MYLLIGFGIVFGVIRFLVSNNEFKNIIDNTKLVLNRDVTYLIYNVTAHCNAKCDHCFYCII